MLKPLLGALATALNNVYLNNTLRVYFVPCSPVCRNSFCLRKPARQQLYPPSPIRLEASRGALRYTNLRRTILASSCSVIARSYSRRSFGSTWCHVVEELIKCVSGREHSCGSTSNDRGAEPLCCMTVTAEPEHLG